MLIFKIVSIGMITLFLYLLFKGKKDDIASMLSLGFTLIVFSLIAFQLNEIINFIRDISGKASVDILYLNIVLKILAISFLCSFASEVCKDAGASSIGLKVEFAGKILILGLSIPILKALLEAIIKIL
ncbi:stage III sporulation protein AD [Inconstantimicrobium mannanitabidum]|uniref:Stage III sporulation protein AD n=1 Tax=Inconstantimicrobium mannanitabidum TaxID=1604901 RepID=A0ACB5RAW9_9CLOT|nr:stage III sporulation protein AD [Clostridium sp. TW13]GKX66148.1 stage III sporulation protein AD [Clostridium sp. TW13]